MKKIKSISTQREEIQKYLVKKPLDNKGKKQGKQETKFEDRKVEILSETQISRRNRQYLRIRYLEGETEKEIEVEKQNQNYNIPDSIPKPVATYIGKINKKVNTA